MAQFPSNFDFSGLLSFLSPFPTVLWMTGFVLYLCAMTRIFRFLEFPAILMGILGSLIGWLNIEKSILSVTTTIEGYSGPFLLPIPKENSEVAIVFMAAGWSSALFLYLLKQKTLAHKQIPKAVPLAFLVSIGLGLGYLAQGTKEAIKIASQPETQQNLLPEVPLSEQSTENLSEPAQTR
jgi:hypothetical protein